MGYVVDQWTVPNPVKDAKPKKIRTPRWGKGKRWHARWDENGRRVSKAFENRDAAEAFPARTSTEQVDGTYIEKAKKTVLVEDVWPIWWAGKAGTSKSTRDGYQAAWKHIEPRWGNVECQKVTRPAIAAWLPSRYPDEDGNPRPLGESAARQVMIVLNGIMAAAVEERVVLANPVKMKDAPKQKASERRYLSVAELDRLEAAMPDDATRLVVDVLVRNGVRPGEAFGLKVGDLDIARGRLRVSRDVDAAGEVDETKSGRHRDVPVGGDLLIALETAEGLGREEWLLGGRTRNRWRPVGEGFGRCWARGPRHLRATAHGGIARHPFGGEREDGSANARARFGGNDSRHRRPSLGGRARRFAGGHGRPHEGGTPAVRRPQKARREPAARQQNRLIAWSGRQDTSLGVKWSQVQILSARQ